MQFDPPAGSVHYLGMLRLHVNRFRSRVDVRGPDECWPWTGSHDRDGYGHFHIWGAHQGASTFRAHRVAFFLEHGRWPEPYCLHRCDNPPCCNPAHLFEGTQRDNVRDTFSKGRARLHVPASGEASHLTKLTDRQVLDIRANYALCRVTQKELAQRFGVARSTVWGIVHNQSRKAAC